MPQLDLSADDMLATTRSVRKRLDFSRPVEPEVIRECLELALQAPTGGNSQSWQFVVVTDAEKRKTLGDLYREGWAFYRGNEQLGGRPIVGDSARAQQLRRIVDSVRRPLPLPPQEQQVLLDRARVTVALEAVRRYREALPSGIRSLRYGTYKARGLHAEAPVIAVIRLDVLLELLDLDLAVIVLHAVTSCVCAGLATLDRAWL